MPHRSSDGRLTVVTMDIKCERHGGHRLILGSLDDTATTAAEVLSAHYTRLGFKSTFVEQRMGLDSARDAVREEVEAEDDDIPF